MRVRPTVILVCLGAIILVAGMMLTAGRYLLGGPSDMAARKHRFDALVQTNDHRAVAEAAIIAIRNYTNAQFLDGEVTNLAPAIAALRPSYVVVYPDAITIEFAGGFDHFGFKVEDQHDGWEMSWYTEGGQHSLLTLEKRPEGGELGGAANRNQPIRSETNRTSSAVGSRR